jgi:hypothetical protein
MAPHGPAPNFHHYPVLQVFPVIQVNSEALGYLGERLIFVQQFYTMNRDTDLVSLYFEERNIYGYS